MIMETVEKTKKSNSFLEVLIIEPESNTISEALGMTEERFKELGEFVTALVKEKASSSKITEDLHQLSLFAKHANELTVMCMFYGKHFGKLQMLSEIADIDPLIIVKLGYTMSQESKDSSEE
jgi:hypothetical protein